MKVSIDPGDRHFLDRLHRLGSGTIQEICTDIGVTATAVRQRLNRLQGLGFVSREVVPTGRGRPHHVYCVSNAGLRQLGDNYEELAIILWKALRSVDDPSLRSALGQRVQDALVKRYGHVLQGESLGERLELLRDEMVERGFDVEVDSSGDLPVLRELNCPYQELAGSDSGICELEIEVFSRVLGADLTLTQCFLDGHNCCEFQAAEKV